MNFPKLDSMPLAGLYLLCFGLAGLMAHRLALLAPDAGDLLAFLGSMMLCIFITITLPNFRKRS